MFVDELFPHLSAFPPQTHRRNKPSPPIPDWKSIVGNFLTYLCYADSMAEAGYKQLISYKLAQIAFDLGWDFVPKYYSKIEDHRQRDQIKQALRSHKQNIVEGSSERSLSSKLKLYDVAKSSCMEALEDFEDILRLEQLPRWNKDDPRL